MRLKPGTPGGMEAYRTTLCLSFLTRYYLRVTSQLVELGKGKSSVMLEELAEDELIAAQELPVRRTNTPQMLWTFVCFSFEQFWCVFSREIFPAGHKKDRNPKRILKLEMMQCIYLLVQLLFNLSL
jgi:hypothetical protein